MVGQKHSIIERMATDFYDAWKADGKVVVAWHELPTNDRRRFVDAMVAAVKRLPDFCDVKGPDGMVRIIIGEGRQALLSNHVEHTP